jgi:hypothetical protein
MKIFSENNIISYYNKYVKKDDSYFRKYELYYLCVL